FPPPDLRLLLVRARLGAVGDRADRRRQRPLRDRLPASDEHVAGAGQHRATTRRLCARDVLIARRQLAAQGPPRQRGASLPPRLIATMTTIETAVATRAPRHRRGPLAGIRVADFC